jgi:alpha-mannosidase/mannosylglycerate hydrolase
VALVHDGPQLATLRIRTTMPVPATFHFDDHMSRSEELAPLVIDSHVTLRAGAERVEVETTVHNVAEDHRLRVLFPSGARGAVAYLADTPFDVVERPIPLRADNHLYRELEVETRSQLTWSAVYDGERGLAVISSGLLESAVRDQPERPLALTLFRATRRTVFTDGEPNGQLPGDLHFRYWLAPLAAAPDRVALCRLGQQLAAGLRSAQLRPADVALHRQAALLPPVASLLQVDGPAVVTSARWIGGSLEVRMFNPTAAAGEAHLYFGSELPFAALQEVDAESNPLAEAQAVAGGASVVTLGAKQIKTLRITA